MKKLALLLCLLSSPAGAVAFSTVPYIFVTSTTYNPSQVMADFQSITNSGNSVGAAINGAIGSHIPEPSGIVLWFNLGACPTGWTSLSGYGTVFVRGVDLGRGIDPTGTARGGAEGYALQDHIHSRGAGVNAISTGQATFGGTTLTYGTGGNVVSNINTGNPSSGSVGADVRPDNVSLLLCSKN